MVRFSRFRGLQSKQHPFSLQAAAVTGEPSGGSDHAVARTITASGLHPLAAPTARQALARPIAAASSE